MKEPKSIFEFMKLYLPNIMEKVMIYGETTGVRIVDGKFSYSEDQMGFVKFYFVEALENYRKAVVCDVLARQKTIKDVGKGFDFGKLGNIDDLLNVFGMGGKK